MATTGGKPKARPIYRRLALGMAFVCFLLGLVLGVGATLGYIPGRKGVDWLLTCTTLFVGFVMLTIARSGVWPPPPRDQRSNQL